VSPQPPEPLSTAAPPLAGRESASQHWSKVSFLHWRVDSSLVAPHLPAGVVPDEFDGTSWVGLIAFFLGSATVLGSPPVPYFGDFAEVNVRLYGVDERGRRGVYFVSLEASRLAAVVAARAMFSIAYFWSRTSVTAKDDTVSYSSTRHFARTKRSGLTVAVSPNRVESDPLADFLTARWALFTTRRGRTIFLPNEHEPWELFEASVVSVDDTLLESAGFAGISAREPDSVLYSPGVTTRFGSAS
jgi:uncharacterized protein YqjF (DUF2071 family)